ncbi:NAD-dependent epimerase/dehydratase family protein [Candidatus Falkowbacteria bacterium]|nr:NAD-dependent epimerase/dehydratase family protein [Candidatus Falkowbacteria bacterium]
MKAIVFGGSGFLGSHVADALTDKGHQVVIFDLKESKYLKSGQAMIIGDILDLEKVKQTVSGAKAVYNFAGLADLDRASNLPLETIKSNILGNAHILESIKDEEIERYIFASSVYVYSKAGSFYKSSKQACEAYIEEYSKKYNIPYTIVRYGSLYGPRADDSNPIYRLLKQIIQEQKISYWGSGEETREYIHVEDAARCSVEILEQNFINQHVILSGHHPIKSKEMLTMINEALGNKFPMEFRQENPEDHYQVTPYSYNPKIGRKYISSFYLDMGQGLLQCFEEIHHELSGCQEPLIKTSQPVNINESNLASKKFKVLFIYPNTMMATLIPLHISQLSACLREKGIETDVFDTTFYKTENINFELKKVELLQVKPFSYEKTGIKLKETNISDDLKQKVENYKPDLIAITLVEDTFELGRALLNSIKDFHVPVIAGGVYATFSPEEVINLDSVNIVCLGEGEEALVELCERMARGQNYCDIKNLWIKRPDGEIIKNPLRPLVDLDKLAVIDFDIFGKERLYRPMFGKIYTMVHLELDRGCPYACTYCEAPRLRELFQQNQCGAYYRKKSAKKIIDEMKHLVHKYNPDYVNFNAESFLARTVEELKEISDLYQEIKIPFWCQSRPETVTEEKIKILKEMGCDSMQFGVEHGNEQFRARMLNRHCTNELMLNALKIVEKFGLSYTVNNIIGFPEETRELIFDTIEFNRLINPRTMNCYLMTPYKGTQIHKFCLEKGYLTPQDKVYQLLDSVPLRNQPLSYEELKGLQRTFPLYVKFSRDEWENIKRAEKFDEKGNRVFVEYQARYRELFFQ